MRAGRDLISQADPVSGARRRKVVDADLALRATGKPCPRCGQWALRAGGSGCRCSGLDAVIARCLEHAEALRASRGGAS